MLAVFYKLFRDSRRMLIWTAVALGLYALFIMSFYPTIAKEKERFEELLDSYPEAMMSLFFGESEDGEYNLSEPGSYLQVYFTTYAVLILGALVITQAFNTFTNAERDSSIDILLSLPVSRRELLAGRLLSTGALLLALLTVFYAAIVICSFIWTEFDANMGRVALAIYAALLPLMVVFTFVLLLVSIIPSSKHFAGPLAYLFLFGSYLVYGFSSSVDVLKDIQPLLLFDYYSTSDIIRHGLNWGHMAALTIVAGVYLALAWWFIDRKELGV